MDNYNHFKGRVDCKIFELEQQHCKDRRRVGCPSDPPNKPRCHPAHSQVLLHAQRHPGGRVGRRL